MNRFETDSYTLQDLHAKVFAFDTSCFVGSANVSFSSKFHLVEAVVRIRSPKTTKSIHEFVESLCITKLSKSDLKDLRKFFVPKKSKSFVPDQVAYSTLLMDLTLEQGSGRETQVQPPKAVWTHYFGLVNPPVGTTITLRNLGAPSSAAVMRAVVKHHHTYTIEISGAHLPRPAILQMHRVGPSSFEYHVRRPGDPSFTTLQKLIVSTSNPLWTSGRRWVLV